MIAWLGILLAIGVTAPMSDYPGDFCEEFVLPGDPGTRVRSIIQQDRTLGDLTFEFMTRYDGTSEGYSQRWAWDGAYLRQALDLNVRYGCDRDTVPPPGSSAVLLLDEQEITREALKVVPGQGLSTNFLFEDSDVVPDLKNHRILSLVIVGPDGKAHYRKDHKLPDWSFLRRKAAAAFSRMIKGYRRDPDDYCSPGNVI